MMDALRVSMTENERKLFSELIELELGIRMPPVKKELLKARLARRLHDNQLDNYTAYYKYLISPAGRRNELSIFVDAVTTNKTEFFREITHYDYLRSQVLPEFSGKRSIHCWSAACSTGQEPYSMAMLLDDYHRNNQTKYTYSILASDISRAVLQTACQAEYKRACIAPVPESFRKQYLLRHKADPERFRITPQLRSRVKFKQLNLLAIPDLGRTFDVIFCKNVLIYFNRANQARVLNGLLPFLEPGGYLFVGHAEILFEFKDIFRNTAPSVYRRMV